MKCTSLIASYIDNYPFEIGQRIDLQYENMVEDMIKHYKEKYSKEDLITIFKELCDNPSEHNKITNSLY